jgi:cytochrome c6
MKLKFNIFFLLLIFFSNISICNAIDLNNGKILFLNNCIVCHKNGGNVIIPEKNLKKEALEENGMNNFDAITYQVINGKNGMPAFGGRLEQKEIEEIAQYVLKQSTLNFNES